MTGISTPSVGPNCLLTAEYRTAIGIHNFRLQAAIPVIPTRPPDNAPNEAPKRLLGSLKKRTRAVIECGEYTIPTRNKGICLLKNS